MVYRTTFGRKTHFNNNQMQTHTVLCEACVIKTDTQELLETTKKTELHDENSKLIYVCSKWNKSFLFLLYKTDLRYTCRC